MRRGLSEDQIAAGTYRTGWSLRVKGYTDDATTLAHRAFDIWGTDIYTVPMFEHARDRMDLPKISWDWCGENILQAWRTPAGKIAALSLRIGDNNREKYRSKRKKKLPKYVTVQGGNGSRVSSLMGCVYPSLNFADRGRRDVGITEGEFKARFAADALGYPFVPFNGVDNIEHDTLNEWFDELKADRVVVYFDMDRKESPKVRKAFHNLCQYLQENNKDFVVAEWPGDAKGIDDFLMSSYERRKLSIGPYRAPERRPSRYTQKRVKRLEIESTEKEATTPIAEARDELEAIFDSIIQKSGRSFYLNPDFIKHPLLVLGKPGLGKSYRSFEFATKAAVMGFKVLRLVARQEQAWEKPWDAVDYKPGRLTVGPDGKMLCQRPDLMQPAQDNRLPQQQICEHLCPLFSSCEYQRRRRLKQNLQQAAAQDIHLEHLWEYDIVIWDDVDFRGLCRNVYHVGEENLAQALAECCKKENYSGNASKVHASFTKGLLEILVTCLDWMRTDFQQAIEEQPGCMWRPNVVARLKTVCEQRDGPSLRELVDNAKRYKTPDQVKTFLESGQPKEEFDPASFRLNFLDDLVAQIDHELTQIEEGLHQDQCLWMDRSEGMRYELQEYNPLPQKVIGKGRVHIVLDSSINQRLLEHFFDYTKTFQIFDPALEMPPGVEFIQYIDRAFGMTDLKSDTGKAAAIKRLRHLIAESPFNGQRGIVTTKSLRNRIESESDLNLDALHFFGQRSSNKLAKVTELFIVGTPCPPPLEILKEAYCIFQGQAAIDPRSEIVEQVHHGDDGCDYPQEARRWRDERLQMLQDDSQRAEIEQALGRGRPYTVGVPDTTNTYFPIDEILALVNPKSVEGDDRVSLRIHYLGILPLAGLVPHGQVKIVTTKPPERPDEVDKVIEILQYDYVKGAAYKGERKLAEAIGCSRRQIRKSYDYLRTEIGEDFREQLYRDAVAQVAEMAPLFKREYELQTREPCPQCKGIEFRRKRGQPVGDWECNFCEPLSENVFKSLRAREAEAG